MTTTEYAGNYVYENGVLQFFNTTEGYVEPKGIGWEYVFQYKDHLGNIRLSYADADGNGIIAQTEIREENNYYPFGLKHKGYNSTLTGKDHKYGFGNKAEQDELGLGWIDITARNYDPALGRWMNLDPVTHFDFSTYSAFDNNPVFWADPSGADAQSMGECSTCDVHGRQTIENGRYVTVSERRKREEKEGNAGIYTSVNAENNQSVNINVADLKSSIDNELNIDKSDNIGEAIVKSFISNIILTIQLEVLIEIAISQKNYNFRGPKPFVAIPEFAVRVRNASGRNSTDENRNYGSVTFSNTFEVLSAVEGDQSGNYGYYYAAGTNVLSSSFKSDNLTYNDRNSFLETTFSGWAYIRFLDENRKKVGELLFRNTKLKDKFVNYFDVVLREKIRKKFAK